ncbi:PAS domain-containing protein [Salicola sp. Rm-C-2C1-2]|uniref:PAS domain-containing protein n=1 Tax=Salicola sp. Rm-C-2C1-2 TaxID=3141321 RepID=UPI0032E41B6C
MEPESIPDTDQPRWYRVLAPLVLGVGLALSLLLWAETRQALTRAATTGNDPVFPDLLLVCGIVLSIGLAFITWRVVRAHRLTIRRQVRLERLRERDSRALENKRLEKEVMSRALSDSEQRTRDFIQLGTAIALELDDACAIGYVSPQVEALLGHTPSTLAGERVDLLLPEAEYQRLEEALNTSRREARHTSLDTWLRDPEGHTLAVNLRVCTVVDALSHCQGFRVVASPRGPIE